MFKRLFCKHEYKFYNTKVYYPLGSINSYNEFQFVCPKCGKEISVSEIEIDAAYSRLKSEYNKRLALGGEPVESSEIVVDRYMAINILYRSPATTLMLEEYLSRGIDLTQIDRRNIK